MSVEKGYNLIEVANLLGLKVRTIRQWVHDGKEYGTVIDFVDDFGMYRGWAKKRKGFYKKLDAEVLE